LFLNPGGLKQILYPLDTLLHQPLNLANVEEWQPTQMTSARGVALLIVLLCCFLPVLLSRAEIFWDEFLLLILAAWLGISHVRMLFAFGILAVPILCRQLSTQWESYDPEQDRIWPNALFFTAALTVAYFLFPSSANLQGQVEAQSPVKAVEFLKASRISGPMLNEYVFGGYLLWAAPEYPVMIDGRADVYEWSGFLAEFGRWATLQSPPNALLDQYKVHFCLLARQSPMARILPLLPEWKSVYADSNSILFVRSATINPAR
jgi:hypothetical protein